MLLKCIEFMDPGISWVHSEFSLFFCFFYIRLLYLTAPIYQATYCTAQKHFAFLSAYFADVLVLSLTLAHMYVEMIA